jgi:CRISPR-associated protein Cas5d
MESSTTSPLSPTLSLRARGPLACFTRPEMKVERVSYPLITPSAARGLLEAVLWKPAIRWRIERIHLLAPVRWIAFRRNEVNSKAVAPSKAVIEDGGIAPHLFTDHDRAQRNTVALRDVDYRIDARFELTARAGAEDNVPKFVDMFRRRVDKGQCFHRPYLGCREFAAEVLPAEGAPPAVAVNEELGLMLWDVEFSATSNRALFFEARLEDGVLEVPQVPLGTLGAASGAAP